MIIPSERQQVYVQEADRGEPPDEPQPPAPRGGSSRRGLLSLLLVLSLISVMVVFTLRLFGPLPAVVSLSVYASTIAIHCYTLWVWWAD